MNPEYAKRKLIQAAKLLRTTRDPIIGLKCALEEIGAVDDRGFVSEPAVALHRELTDIQKKGIERAANEQEGCNLVDCLTPSEIKRMSEIITILATMRLEERCNE